LATIQLVEILALDNRAVIAVTAEVFGGVTGVLVETIVQDQCLVEEWILRESWLARCGDEQDDRCGTLWQRRQGSVRHGHSDAR